MGPEKEVSSEPVIRPVSGNDENPCSFGQQRLWFLDQLEGPSALYNLPFALKITGPLRLEALKDSLNHIVRRHDVLRTTFADRKGHPVQIVAPDMTVPLPVIDLRPLSDVERDAEVERRAMQETQRPFDLGEGPLIRASLLWLRGSEHPNGNGEYVLLISIHHIVSDDWSLGVLGHELSVLYEACVTGKPSPLPPLPIQYADFASWQRQWLEGDRLNRELAYWKEQLAGIPGLLELPADRPRPAVQTFKGRADTFVLDADLTRRLNLLSQRCGATLFMTLLAAFGLLLSRYNGEEDIVIGSPIANRNRKEIEPLIGFFVNTLVLRIDISGNPSFKTLLERVRQLALDAYAHQNLPFERLVDELQPERTLSHSPLFQVMFVFKNASTSGSLSLPGLQIDPLSLETGRTHFDLVMCLTQTDSQLSGMLEYSTDLFDPESIARMMQHFQLLLGGITEDPDQSVWSFPLLNAADRRRILEEWNDTRRDYPYHECVHHLFELQAGSTPEVPAVFFDGATWSYGELNDRANKLAHLLRKKGVGPDRVVGIMTDRSPDMVLGILAILKAGGACLPIDPEYPEERILTMLNDSGALLLLTKERLIGQLSFTLLQNLRGTPISPIVTRPRAPVDDFDQLPDPDRSLVSYEKYHEHIGLAPAKHTVSLQTSRGCPFNCLYCHRIWPKQQKSRSAERIFDEIRRCYDAGVGRFVIVDDIFNLDKRTSTKLLQKIIKDRLKVQLFFPNGLRGDILTKDYIDLLVEAGTVDIAVALESASPRIQKLVRKNLDLDRFRDNLTYITRQYPELILEMHMMFGFPTETEEEALLTFDFLKGIEWVHFPNLFILKIFPNTDMAAFAVESGIPQELIERSANRAYHQLPETLPFSESFVREYQSRFMGDYFLSKDRLLSVLPAQLKVLTEGELVQKYESYLPGEIGCLSHILRYAGLTEGDLGDVKRLPEDFMKASGFSEKTRDWYPVGEKRPEALRILLLDLSLLFDPESGDMLYDMVEAPLGLMYLMTYLEQKFGRNVSGKIAKSRIDFDSFEELKGLMKDFHPQLVGIRTLSFYKNFFHTTVSLIRQWYPDIPIITGGPYGTSECNTILADRNVDVVVLGEGELTFAELVERVMENGGFLPPSKVLEQIPGLAFLSRQSRGAAREVLMLDQMEDALAGRERVNPERLNRGTDLAYVLYTSGSTGKPKGVAMVHQAISNLILWHLDDKRLSRKARTLQFAPYTFDVSFQEIFSTLCSGGTLFLISEDTRRDAGALWRFVNEYAIERLFLPFVALHQLAEFTESSESLPSSLRDVVTAGEQLQITPAIAAFFERLPRCFLHNHYGPVETHVATTFTLHGSAGGWPKLPPIGRPVANARIYILDRQGVPVPVGVPGELHIGGIALARGYQGHPALTAQRFISDPFTFLPESRLYRTGDSARWLSDGNIEYLGRIDNQVKIRGFRIEPGEIESVLAGYPGVREAAVVAREYGLGDRRLLAYVAMDTGANTVVSNLRDFLKEKLPEYMVPSTFTVLERLPLTASGKVDRRSLSAISGSPPGGPQGGKAPPRTPAEEILASLWAEVLKVEQVGIHDNFFDLGGHSLLATQLISRIRDAFSRELPVRQLFESPTIAQLCEHMGAGGLAATAGPIRAVERDGDLPLSFAQERLWFLTQFEGETASYNMPAALKLTGTLDIVALEQSLNAIMNRHESLRTVFPVKNGYPVQVIQSPITLPLLIKDLRNLTGEEKLTEFQRLATKEAGCPFDLTYGPLIRMTLFQLANEEHVLLINIHHIVFDGWSVGIFIDELSINYNALLNKTAPVLPELTVQYADYACWQRENLTNEIQDSHLNYWISKLEKAPVEVLPVDISPPEVRSYRGGTVSFEIDPVISRKLHYIALKAGASFFMTLLSAFNAILFRVSGQEDIVIGVPIANRNRKEIEPLIGFFVNILPFRTDLSGNPTFEELLKRVRKVTLDAYAHQDVPFVKLVQALRPDRKWVRQPLYQASFGLMQSSMGEPRFSGLELEQLKLFSGMAPCDLFLSVTETENGLISFFAYDTDIFKSRTITMLAEHFKMFLKAVVHAPERSVLDVAISVNSDFMCKNETYKRIVKDEIEEFQF